MSCYLITGDRGFIGSDLKRFLGATGYNVIGFDKLSDYPTVEVLEDFMRKNDVKRIFHLGARAFIPDCYSGEILNVVNSNVTFTANLLLAAKRAEVEKLLYFSTSEVYGSQAELPINENAKPNPQSTYAATKFAAENICRTFSIESDFPVVVMRQFNVYGPRDKHPRVIPKLMHAAKHRKSISFGSHDFTRDFTYVRDAAIAAVNLMSANTSNGEIYNHGSGVETSCDELISCMCDLYGVPITTVSSEHNFRPWDVRRLCCDRSKYVKKFPNHTPMALSDGLKITQRWYDENDWPWEGEKTRE